MAGAVIGVPACTAQGLEICQGTEFAEAVISTHQDLPRDIAQQSLETQHLCNRRHRTSICGQF